MVRALWPLVFVSAAASAAPLTADGEAPTGAARAELVAVQTLHGAAQGLFLTGTLDGDDGMGTALTLTGALLGGGGAFLLSREGISAGPMAAIDSGLFWGLLEATAFLFARNGRIDPHSQVDAAAGMVFTVGFSALGFLVATELRPRAGMVAAANSTAFWATVIATGLTISAALEPQTRSLPAITALVAMNAGLVGGGLLGWAFQPGRLRMFLIDVGGTLGWLFGLGVSFLVAQELSIPVAGVSTAIFSGVGVGVATLLTRKMTGDAAPDVSLVPLLGETRGLALAGRF